MAPTRWLAVLVGTSLFLRCASDPSLDLRGPLLKHASWLPTLPASCSAISRTYAVPFHVAPYRSCRHQDGPRFTNVEIDTEGTVVDVYEIATISSTGRQAAFDSVAATLSEHLGKPTLCAPTALWWDARDSVQAALRLAPTGDAWPEAEAREWRLVKIVRYGPLADTFTCPSRD